MRNIIVKIINKRKGKGVFAARYFMKGDVILTYKKTKLFKGNEVPKVWKNKFRYLDCVGKDKYMIMQKPERYINSSCDPNIYIKNWKIIAMKPIRKGEQLTFDYSINNDFSIAFKCICDAENCRGFYSISFFKLNKKLQKKYLPYLDTWFKKLYKKELSKVKN